jgi:predicted membrane protein
MSNFYNYVIAPASTLIPLTIGAIRYKLLNTGSRILIAFLSLSVIASVLTRLFAYLFHNNIIVNNLYTLLEFPLLACFYYFHFPSSKMRKVTLIMILAFMLVCIYLIIIYYNVNRFDDYSTSTESLLLIFLSLALTNSRNNSLNVSNRWDEEPVNWFNTGILLQFSGSLFIFLLMNYFLYDQSHFYIAWNALVTFSICMNVLFSIGFYKIKKEQEAVVVAR